MPRVWNTDYGNVCDTEHYLIERLSREEHALHAIIYTKPNCPKCRLTDARLTIPHTTRMATDADYTRFRQRGYQSMPVVTVYKPDGTHDEWCDFRVDKIKQYTKD